MLRLLASLLVGAVVGYSLWGPAGATLGGFVGVVFGAHLERNVTALRERVNRLEQRVEDLERRREDGP